MRLTLSQKEKYEQLFKCIGILFESANFGLLYSEIKDAWVYGTTLRDLILFKNPPVTEYTFYIQVDNKESIYGWLSSLSENEIDFELTEKDFIFEEEKIFQLIAVSLSDFGIDQEIQIAVGNISINEYIYDYCPVASSLTYLDISDVFLYLSKNEKIEKISHYIKIAPEMNKDVKTKTVTILKQEWMKNPKNYNALECYLEKTYQKLLTIGYK